VILIGTEIQFFAGTVEHPARSVSRVTNEELNVVVEWLTRLLRIRQVPGSNLDPETSYRN
jgi:hypothetical protein